MTIQGHVILVPSETDLKKIQGLKRAKEMQNQKKIKVK